MKTYEEYMKMRQIELATIVIGRQTLRDNVLPGVTDAAIRKMRKADLAQKLVTSDAAALPLISESQSKTHTVRFPITPEKPITMQSFKAFKAKPGERRNLKKARCGCDQYVNQLENGTMQRHTRMLHKSGWSVDPTRVRCEWSGMFPPAMVNMRQQTTYREFNAQKAQGTPVVYTYKSVQIGDSAKVGGVTGSRRARKVGTKNKHRANFGKRFQVRAV